MMSEPSAAQSEYENPVGLPAASLTSTRKSFIESVVS